MTKELSDFPNAHSEGTLPWQNGKTKSFQDFFRNGLFRTKNVNSKNSKLPSSDGKSGAYTIGETNLGVNTNPGVDSGSMPSSGQVTPATGKLWVFSI